MAGDYPFTNAFRELLGVRRLESDAGRSRLTIDPVADDLLQSRGIVHGGVLATLVDVACGEAARSLLQPGQTLATIELNISYLNPGATRSLIAEGHVIKQGRTIMFGTVDVLGDAGQVLASGRASMTVR